MFLLVTFIAGCKDALDVYESKAPTAVVVSTNGNGTISLAARDLSSEVTFVTGIVQRVELPLVNSPSIAGDKANYMLLVSANSIPAHPDSQRVVLHYDNHGWLQDLKAGMQLVLRFHKHGEFDGVQFPAVFMQQNGTTNRTQPARAGIE
jgi:hypothetical protein